MAKPDAVLNLAICRTPSEANTSDQCPADREVSKRSREGAPQMPKWNFVAMGQVGLTGWTR